jgi:hypothetical protein
MTKQSDEVSSPRADDDLQHVPGVANVRAALRALPQEPAPPDIWKEVERRMARSARPAPRSRVLVYASAAALLAIVGTLVLVRLATESARPATVQQTDPDPVSALVAESQRLERDLFAKRASPRISIDSRDYVTAWATSRDAVVYRLADIDDELLIQSLAPVRDPARAERLWRQRVELMQSLGDLERAQQWQAYRTVVF